MSLSVKRRKETPEYAGMVRRVTAGLGHRVASGDIASLPLLEVQRVWSEAVMGLAIQSLVEKHGYSWTEVARELGVSRQAARQRWGRGQPRAGA